MILGMRAVVNISDIRLGSFYLMEFSGEACVTQCVQAPQLRDGDSELVGLRFSPDTPYPLSLEDLPRDTPVIALHEVRVRVDAPSAFKWSTSSPIKPGMFLVAGEEAFIAVPRGFREWVLVNIMTGRIAHNRLRDDWVAFSRWLLVIEENGEEIPIVSFGGEA